MGAIEIRCIDHVVLRVRDVAASKRFYCDALGCMVERESEALGLHQLRAGASLIDLVPVAGPLGKLGGAGAGAEGRNVDHFALALAAFDAAAIAFHLRARGIETDDVTDRYGAGGMGPSIYIRDPDGNVVELKGPARS
jgi:catechol 2,3-dioxygenase-like lactoylglutathione lyase family enzyme